MSDQFIGTGLNGLFYAYSIYFSTSSSPRIARKFIQTWARALRVISLNERREAVDRDLSWSISQLLKDCVNLHRRDFVRRADVGENTFHTFNRNAIGVFDGGGSHDILLESPGEFLCVAVYIYNRQRLWEKSMLNRRMPIIPEMTHFWRRYSSRTERSFSTASVPWDDRARDWRVTVTRAARVVVESNIMFYRG